ncbi:MAG: hypothetical protein GEU90_11315 [Gemmatimonas sp.]|nr:hypothetical protein [Gemmatimonas sp.]
MITNRLQTLAVMAALFVGLSGCTEAPDEAEAEVAAAADAPAEAMPESEEATVEAGAVLDPEQAAREELLGVPGIDAEAADALIAGRPYDDMVVVDQVLADHLDQAEREIAYAILWKPLDLNTATGDEILLIPGMDERMRHEFEEYRPYTEIQQFRDEIGKYVDTEEVARLERYVMISVN